MADQDDYRKRSQELLAEHEEFRDDSLRYNFFDYLDNFEGGNERVLAGELSEEQLAMMGIVSDVKMSDEGLAILRHAAANEVDNWTADLRKKEKVLDELCAVSDNDDPVMLGRLLSKAYMVMGDSRTHRYEELLGSLSADDRAILDTVFFDTKAGKINHQPYPVNAEHILDQLHAEFPERVFYEVKYECENHERNRGKHYVKYVEQGPSKTVTDESGNFVVVLGSSSSGYKLVDN